jgi:hypothetical protein
MEPMREPSTFRFRQAQTGRGGARPRPTRPRPRARFLEGRAKTLSVLEVDFPLATHSPDRLRRALFALRIQVIAEIRQQIGGRVVHWMRVVEFDGAPIGESRGSALQRELIGLLEDGPTLRRAPAAVYSASTGS